MMRNTLIDKRQEILVSLGGIPEPEVTNEEWLYLLKEETRNSILIEGVFISEDELEEVLSKGIPLKKNQQEALNYFRTAKYFYEMAYQNHKTGEFMFSLSMIRQINKMLYEGIKAGGEYRKGDVKITGSKIVPPGPYVIEKWLAVYKYYIVEALNSENFIRFLAIQHILFEVIHPFEDCNGRTGRIILNYLLLSKGYPIVILKGDEENRERYYRSLEQGDRVLNKLTRAEFDKDPIRKSLDAMNVDRMKTLVQDALRVSIDRILIKLYETKKGIIAQPAKDVAHSLRFAPDSMRTLINRGKFIAVKRGKEWFTHEKFELTMEK
ncbi:MAG: Fic family protein [Nitrospiraceae bacterium]|nr:MAG: Fic family protein [Nitrospiraceae bacterium]